jgi:cholesterol oxidase
MRAGPAATGAALGRPEPRGVIRGAGQRPGDPITGPAGAPEQNLHGAVRYTCNLCGGCNFGCNSGSKNTLDHTYLSMADRTGADIRDRCEVRTVTPARAGDHDGQVVPEGRRPRGAALVPQIGHGDVS